jgi:hypothetical protein
MWERARQIWNTPIFTIGDKEAIEVGQLVLVLLVVVIGYLASRLVESLIRRRLANTHLKADAAYALQRVSFYVLLVVVAMTAMSLLRIPLTAFAFISGAVAIGVGFGAQNIVNNFISSWILMSERPVRIDDWRFLFWSTSTTTSAPSNAPPRSPGRRPKCNCTTSASAKTKPDNTSVWPGTSSTRRPCYARRRKPSKAAATGNRVCGL